jgi:uncharacterized protein
MNDRFSRFGKWALIAGAAEGIGAAFSNALAGYGMNLILIDNNGPMLNSLADDLEIKTGVKTIRIILELSEENAVKICLEQVVEIDVRLLVYVPAYSRVGKFTEYSVSEIDRFLSLNTRTPIQLVHSFLSRKRKGETYSIILMSSLAGMIGTALAAPYAATKGFLILLAESLFHELKKDNVEIVACCAGPTSTPTYWNSNPGKQSKLIDVMESADVATYALKMLGKKPFCIPGWKNRLFYHILIRIIPRKISGDLVSISMKKMYQDQN